MSTVQVTSSHSSRSEQTTTSAEKSSIAVDDHPRQKQMTFEVKSNSFNRQVQVKTKQEEHICTRKPPLPSLSSPVITCSTTTTEYFPPQRVQIEQPTSIQSVRLRVNSATEETPTVSTKKNVDRRPLLDLLNDVQPRRHTITQASVIPTLESLPPPPSPTPSILPAKSFNPFRPVIIHRKCPPNPFESKVTLSNSPDSLSSRNGLLRSHTFTTPTDLSSSTPEVISTSSTSLTSTSPGQSTASVLNNIDDKYEAKRKAIALQMYDTENSYVEALKNLVTKYYLPMKDKAVVSNELINDIFYKIPEIHIHHTAFFISLSQKLTQWDNKQTVGDLLLQMFTRTSVIETYTGFVNNYKTAQLAIRLCRDFSSFNKFLEQQARDHRGKLTLRDLIIQPVQRIPRYELYIKDFLRCTNFNHPDYQLLLKAQSEIHSLAEQIDQVQREVGSTDLTVTNNSLEVVQEMIENLNDLVQPDRYYIRHDVVTVQSTSGLKKDRCIFLFNDLILITSCKRRSGTLTKKTTHSIIVNSPSGKQYIDNAKHKLLMKIPLESIDLAEDRLKKTRRSITTPPLAIKSAGKGNVSSDEHRHLEEDVLVLGQINDLAKTITVPHQQLDQSIIETLQTVNKQLSDDTMSVNQLQTASPEPSSLLDVNAPKGTNTQLIINTNDRTEIIDVLFCSSEQKLVWEKGFLEAKKILFETAAGRRNITLEDVLTLPQSRPGSQFSCGAARFSLNDLCVCNSEGEISLISIEPNLILKTSNRVTSSRINSIAYVPSYQGRKTASTIRRHRKQEDQLSNSVVIHSLLDIDSSDDDEENFSSIIPADDHFSLNDSNENLRDDEEHPSPSNGHDTREATIWLATQQGGIFLYQCSQTMERKNRIGKQIASPIYVILYTHNKVFLALNHSQLCVFRRDLSGHWNLDYPILRCLEENSDSLDLDEDSNAISVMVLVAGRLWCAIRDRIFVVCPNSLNVEHSFVVDDCHRHVSCIATGGSSMHHVWIASQGSHEIRLYHATHFTSLLETSIRTAVTQKLQVCDDIIRAHKLGCLHVTALHICKETLWVGTSAGVILNISLSQLIDSTSSNGGTKFASNSLQIKPLMFGHAGPVRLILSTDTNTSSTVPTEEMKTLVLTIGDGFEDYNHNDETLGKDDAHSHLILWQI